MNESELNAHLTVSRDRAAYVSCQADARYHGFVRTVWITKPAEVHIDFEDHGYDEGGAYFTASYSTLEDAIKSLEDYLGRSLAKWKNERFTDVNRPKSWTQDVLDAGLENLRHDLRAGQVCLPLGAHFNLSGDYWVNISLK